MGVKKQQREQWDKAFDESTQRKDFAGDGLSRVVRRAYTSFLAVPCRTRFETEILETDWRTDFETKLQGLRIIVILLVFEAKLYYNDAARTNERPQLDFLFDSLFDCRVSNVIPTARVSIACGYPFNR